MDTPTLKQTKLSLQIETILRNLRIDGTLDGFHLLIYAIQIAVLDPMTTSSITKTIYIDTARYFDAEHTCVERSIRTAISAFWREGNREELDRMAGYHLIKRPTNSKFIDIIASYIRLNF